MEYYIKRLLFILIIIVVVIHFLISRFFLSSTIQLLTSHQSPVFTSSEPFSKPFPISQWIHQSYKQTYALLEKCPSNLSFYECLEFTSHSLSENTANHSHDVPWWFRTIVRDASNRRQGLHGPWHNIYLEGTNATVCVVEKVGSSQWRKMSCILNGNNKFRGQPCKSKQKPPRDGKKIVFLRDPLERFLSAYLDKCVRRKREKHCEPNEVFNQKENKLMEGLDENPRAKFEAYVDGIPLKWNLHFFPISWNCDGLYRNIHDYDFVGKMDGDFYRNLSTLGKQFGRKMTTALEDVYQISKKINKTNSGTETKAVDYLQEYYSARTIRRVLEYFSIDYIKLNMTVPEWAHEIMLKEDYMIAGR